MSKTKTKDELIAKYGEEWYREYRARANENQRRRNKGLPPLPRKERVVEPSNDLTIKMDVFIPYGEEVEYCERVDEICKFAGKVQNELRRWWRTDTGRTDFILVADAVSRARYKPDVLLTIDLTMLDLNDDLKERFKWGAPKVVRDYMDNN